jgi:hypothetical protein
MSDTISELEEEEFKGCEAMLCRLPPSQTECPGGFCLAVASPYGMAEVCINEKEFECLKHLGFLTEENSTEYRSVDYHKVSVILDILKQCPAG